MLVLGLRQHQTCAACGGEVPIARLFDEARCPRCDAVIEFDDALVIHVEWRRDGAWSSRDGRTRLETKTRDAACPRCDAFLPELRTVPNEIGCACGARVPTRRIDDARLEGIATHVLGEAPELDTAPLVAREAITVHCSTCGGPIDARGDSRSVRCAHCGVDVIVPDNIWERIQGNHVAPWIYLWRPTPRVARDRAAAKLSTVGFAAIVGFFGGVCAIAGIFLQWFIDAEARTGTTAAHTYARLLIVAGAWTVTCAVLSAIALRRVLAEQ